MLTINNLVHVYGNGTRALDDVSLTIPTGMFGLLGPNGAGKSTLMRTIATLQTPTSGEIQFGDIDVIRQPELLRRLCWTPPEPLDAATIAQRLAAGGARPWQGDLMAPALAAAFAEIG